MVDVDRRPPLPHGLPRPPSHAAGLRRLSTRASAPTTPRASSSSSTPSPSSSSSAAASPSPSALLAHLSAAGVSILPGLSESELAHAEAAALGGIQLPPDLRDLLAAGVPSGDGFPDYRSPPGLRLLRFAAEEVPAAVAARLRVGQRGRYCSSPPPPPPLVPVYGRNYLPAVPCLAGNPVFHVSGSGVAVSGANLATFLLRAFAAEPPRLRRQLSAPMPPPPPVAPPPSSTARRSLDSATGKAPRWIEFWTAAAAAADRFVEVTTASAAAACATPPRWVRSYLDWAGSVLRRGGWGGGEVDEMTSTWTEEEEALALTVDRCCGEMARGGWGAEEVVEAMGALLAPRRRAKKPAVALPPDVAARVGKLAEAVFTGSGSAGNPEPAATTRRRF
uniref:Knr4/Smi1-like domain-containing protein n=1 Tax=Leersia perrieri TaxID=77586 RepID=A0A0D9VUW7_9ORYZ